MTIVAVLSYPGSSNVFYRETKVSRVDLLFFNFPKHKVKFSLKNGKIVELMSRKEGLKTVLARYAMSQKSKILVTNLVTVLFLKMSHSVCSKVSISVLSVLTVKEESSLSIVTGKLQPDEGKVRDGLNTLQRVTRINMLFLKGNDCS